MFENEEVEEIKDEKRKELISILKEGGKPYVKKCDGYAVKMTEDKEIKYKDHDGIENTLSVPSGSYVITEGSSSYPNIITAEEFEKKNKFIEGEYKKESHKEEKEGRIGIELMLE